MIFCTGMESEDCLRLMGLRTHKVPREKKKKIPNHTLVCVLNSEVINEEGVSNIQTRKHGTKASFHFD